MAQCRKLVSPPLCPLPHPARGRRGLAGVRPQAAAHQLAPCAPSLPGSPPGGFPMRLSRTHGGRGRTLQRPHPPWVRHSRVGFLLWADCRKLVSPPLSPPRPPMAASWQGYRHGRTRPCLYPCQLAAIPVCPPRGTPHAAKPCPWRPRPHFAAAAPSMATAQPNWLPAMARYVRK